MNCDHFTNYFTIRVYSINSEVFPLAIKRPMPIIKLHRKDFFINLSWFHPPSNISSSTGEFWCVSGAIFVHFGAGANEQYPNKKLLTCNLFNSMQVLHLQVPHSASSAHLWVCCIYNNCNDESSAHPTIPNILSQQNCSRWIKTRP